MFFEKLNETFLVSVCFACIKILAFDYPDENFYEFKSAEAIIVVALLRYLLVVCSFEIDIKN